MDVNSIISSGILDWTNLLSKGGFSSEDQDLPTCSMGNLAVAASYNENRQFYVWKIIWLTILKESCKCLSNSVSSWRECTLSLYALCRLVMALRKSPRDTLAKVSSEPSPNSTSSSACKLDFSDSKGYLHSYYCDCYGIESLCDQVMSCIQGRIYTCLQCKTAIWVVFERQRAWVQ